MDTGQQQPAITATCSFYQYYLALIERPFFAVADQAAPGTGVCAFAYPRTDRNSQLLRLTPSLLDRVVQGGTCLPDDGQQWAVLAWVVYSLGVLFAIATFAVAKVITYRRASSVGRTLSIERQITPAQRQAAEGEGEGEGDEESGNPRRRRGSAGSAEARASSGSRAGAPAEAATGTAANEGGQTRASVSRLKAHVQALVAKLDFLARALAHHEDINAIANALLGQLEMAAQGGAPNGATPRASNGLSAEQIAGLPTARVAERFFDPDAASKDAGGNAEAETCPICLDVLEAGDEVRELPCEHIFHLECVDEWLAREATCPRCRHRADAPSSGRPSISGSARPSLVDRSSPRSSLGAAMPTVEAAQGSLPRAPTSSALRLSPLQPAPRTPLPSAPSRSRLSQEGDYGERSSSVDRDTAAASVASWLAVTSLEASPVHGAPGVLGDGRGDDLDYASEGGVRSEQRNES